MFDSSLYILLCWYRVFHSVDFVEQVIKPTRLCHEQCYTEKHNGQEMK